MVKTGLCETALRFRVRKREARMASAEDCQPGLFGGTNRVIGW